MMALRAIAFVRDAQFAVPLSFAKKLERNG
jgi:hypothetical protein